MVTKFNAIFEDPGTGILRLYMTKSNNNLRMALYKYLGAKDDRYADKVITSAIAFKKSIPANPINDISENGKGFREPENDKYKEDGKCRTRRGCIGGQST